MENKDLNYLGKGWGFPPQITLTDLDVVLTMVSDEEDIEQAIRIILSTQLGERVFRRDFGVDKKDWLFSSISNTFLSMVRDAVEEAIYKNEPRVVPFDITVSQSTIDSAKIDIEINYLIKETNSRKNLVYPFYINENNGI